MSNARLLTCLMVASCAASPLPAQASLGLPRDTTARPDAGAIAGGVFGSGLGLVGGFAAGMAFGEEFDIGQGGDTPGLSVGLGGALVGSVVGTAAGTALFASPEAAPRPSLGRRLRDASVGMLLGLAVFWGTANLTESETVGIVGYSVTQGVYAGLSNGRW